MNMKQTAIAAFFSAFALSITGTSFATDVKAPSVFFDEVMPIRGSVGLFNAMKNEQIGELYIRPRNYEKTLRPVYKISYVNDFESCSKFDDQRTLYQGIMQYKLSAGIFDKNASVDLFMEEPNSANLVNGECLLAVKTELPATDFTVKYKSKKALTYQIQSGGASGTDGSEVIEFENFNITYILSAMGQTPEELPRYKDRESNIGKVSDVNIARALKSDNDTIRHTALYLIHNRMKEYSDEYERLEPTRSPQVLETLLDMDYLKSIDETTRASALKAIGVVMTPSDSAVVKRAILTAFETDYPFTVDRSSRDFGKKFGIAFPDEGELRPGHMSRKIVLGAAMPLHEMSSKDRAEVLEKFPEIMEKLSGSYKNLRETRMLRKKLEN